MEEKRKILYKDSATGRILGVHELELGSKVVVCREGKAAITMWVIDVNEHRVELWAGGISVTTRLSIQPDGTLRDERGGKASIHENPGTV